MKEEIEENDNCKMVRIDKQTRVGLTFGQIASLIVVIFSFTMSYAALNARITALETSQKKYDMVQGEQMKMIYEIRETVIKINTKLEMK